jgi:hypothetical protein
VAPSQAHPRSLADFDRAVRAFANHFKTDTVIVIGSQAVLANWAEAPMEIRLSREIDAYPANAREWEEENRGLEASEEINVFFGAGSLFETSADFYIAGVDEKTAQLPPDWKERSISRAVADGDKFLKGIAPAIEDVIVSKL